MRRASFYADTNRSGNLMHIETDGAIVNIQVGLRDNDGNQVTVVSVLPDDETRSPDPDGHYWHTEDADGSDTRGAHIRVVRQPSVPREAGMI